MSYQEVVTNTQEDDRKISGRKLAGKLALAATVVTSAALLDYSVGKFQEYAEQNPPTSNLEQIKRDLGVAPESAPAINSPPETEVATYVVPPQNA